MIKTIKKTTPNGIEYTDYVEYISPNNTNEYGSPVWTTRVFSTQTVTTETNFVNTNTNSLKNIIEIKQGSTIKAKMQIFERFNIGYSLIEPVIENGKQLKNANIPVYDFLIGRPNDKWGDWSTRSYDGKYTRNGKIDIETTTNGKISNTWTGRGYKNFINWSLWERRSTGWGDGQPTGVFIIDSKYYGAKPTQFGYFPTVANVGGVIDIYKGNDLFLDKSKGTVKPNISIAAAGGYYGIWDNKVDGTTTNSMSYPFFGRVTLPQSNKSMFFAGANVGSSSPKELSGYILKHFNDLGIYVNRCVIGDGGPSTGFVVDGKPIIGGNRGVSVIISW